MNVYRRGQIREAMEKLGQAENIIDTVRGEERDAYDNLPYSFQNSEQGEKMEEIAESLDEAFDEIQALQEKLEGIIGG